MRKILMWLSLVAIIVTVGWLLYGDIPTFLNGRELKGAMLSVFLLGVCLGWLLMVPHDVDSSWELPKVRKELSKTKLVRERAKMASQLLN